MRSLLCPFLLVLPCFGQSPAPSVSPQADQDTKTAIPFLMQRTGSFIKGKPNLNVQSLVNGCDPGKEFYYVQYDYGTEALTGCATGTPDAKTHQITGVAGYATSSNPGAPDAVGVYSQGRALVNGAHSFGGNDVTQDVYGLTSGVALVGREVDVQPYNRPSAYLGGYGLDISLGGNNYAKTGCTQSAPCNYGFSAIGIHSGPKAGGQTWNRGIEVLSGAIANSVLYVQPVTGAATVSTNYNGPNLWDIFNTGWNSEKGAAFTNEWTANSRIQAGQDPKWDMFYNQIIGPVNNVAQHHFALTSYQNMDLAFVHADGTFSRVGVSSSLRGVDSTFTLPATSGVGLVAKTVAQHSIPAFITSTGSSIDAAVVPSSLADDGKKVTTTETFVAAAFATAANAAVVGTAANPSMVDAGSAAAGAFSCSPAASGGTCTISDRAVTPNSEIMVQFVSSVGRRLGVSCNTAPKGMPPIILATQAAGTFTVNLPEFAGSPLCGVFTITN